MLAPYVEAYLTAAEEISRGEGDWPTKGFALRENVLRNLFPVARQAGPVPRAAGHLAGRPSSWSTRSVARSWKAATTRRAPCAASVECVVDDERQRGGARRERPRSEGPDPVWTDERADTLFRLRARKEDRINRPAAEQRVTTTQRAGSAGGGRPHPAAGCRGPVRRRCRRPGREVMVATASRQSVSSRNAECLPVTISSARAPGSQSTSTDSSGRRGGCAARPRAAGVVPGDPTKTEKSRSRTFSAVARAASIASSSPR